jgi:hypothetical protein
MTSLYVARAEQPPWLQQWLEEHAVSWFAALATSRKADNSMLSAVVVSTFNLGVNYIYIQSHYLRLHSPHLHVLLGAHPNEYSIYCLPP